MKNVLVAALCLILGAGAMFGIIELARADGSGSAVLVPPFEGVGSAVTAIGSGSAAPSIDPAADPEGFLRMLLDAATTGKWKVLAGLVLVALVYVTRRWVLGRVDWFQTRTGGIVLAIGLATAGTLGLSLAGGGGFSVAILLNAVSTAVAAAGLWQWLQGKQAKA